jgi:hypothetical protein
MGRGGKNVGKVWEGWGEGPGGGSGEDGGTAGRWIRGGGGGPEGGSGEVVGKWTKEEHWERMQREIKEIEKRTPYRDTGDESK